MKLIKLTQIFFKSVKRPEDMGVDPHDGGTNLLPVIINPSFIVSCIEDEITQAVPIVGQKNIERCTAILVQGMEEPYFVKETLDEVIFKIEEATRCD